MQLVNTITDDPKQSFQVFIEGGEILYITLYYYITQKSWFYNFSYGDYTCNGSRVVLTYNSIRHLKNLLPFGIAFLTDSNAEPCSLNDFSSGRIKMYILDKNEVEEIESEIFNV